MSDEPESTEQFIERLETALRIARQDVRNYQRALAELKELAFNAVRFENNQSSKLYMKKLLDWLEANHVRP